MAAGLGIAGYATSVLRRPELASVDARFSVRGKESPPRDVVVVGLDAQSLQKLGNGHAPIPRRYHAKVIDTLRRDGARVIAYDFQFENETDPTDDNALFEAIGRANGVVLATATVGANGSTPILGGDENLRRVHAVAASINFPKSAARGGVFRRLPYSDRGLRTLAVVAAERAMGHPVDRSRFSGDGAWIDFAGPAGTVKTVPLADVVAGKIPAGVFRGKVVVVGRDRPDPSGRSRHLRGRRNARAGDPRQRHRHDPARLSAARTPPAGCRC